MPEKKDKINPISLFFDILRLRADIEKSEAQYIMIGILPAVFLILAFFYASPVEIFYGVKKMILASDVYLTDYIELAGLGPALFNASVLCLALMVLLKKLKINLGGMIIAGIFLTLGFGLMGKNIYNVWPFYIGGYIFTRVKKLDFRSVVGTSIFSSSIAPVVSIITTLSGDNIIGGVLSGYVVGIIIGFFMPKINSHMLNLHYGYSLYNTGLATGFVAGIFNSVFKQMGIIHNINIAITYDQKPAVLITLFLYFLFLVVYGYFYNNKSYEGYNEILEHSGRLVTDFPKITSFPLTIMNMGFIGLIGLSFCFIIGAKIHANVIAGILSMVGFASFGKHPKNCIPILIGVMIAGFLYPTMQDPQTVAVTGTFATTLAPIAGEYGPVIGVIIGAVELAVNQNTAGWHGGINLYNTGFSSGIVAMLAIPVFDALGVTGKYGKEE